MRPTFIIAALIAASPAFAARCPHGQLFRVRLDECVSLSSPLARPYLKPAEGKTTRTANVGKQIDTPPEAALPDVVDPAAADPPPDKVDEAAWRMIPLLRAVEMRWAAMVSPRRVEAPSPDHLVFSEPLWASQFFFPLR